MLGDIGATNARFAVADSTNGRTVLSRRTTLPSRGFHSFDDAIEAFFAAHPDARRCRRACFGLAGPIDADRCELTNLGLVVDRLAVERRFALDHAHLLNDVEAAAWGLSLLGTEGLYSLRPGVAAIGNRALLSVGTGLGEAALVWNGRRHVPFATEGGHSDFAATDETQVELWRYLRRLHGHVSWERLLSGPGLVTLFRFCLERAGKKEPAWLARELGDGEGDPAAAITAHARVESCPVCRQALDLFFALLGAEAGNLALKFLATGGVYLLGGILPKLLPELDASRFLGCFEDKGRYQPFLRQLPVHVVVDEDVCLWGAAARAELSRS